MSGPSLFPEQLPHHLMLPWAPRLGRREEEGGNRPRLLTELQPQGMGCCRVLAKVVQGNR